MIADLWESRQAVGLYRWAVLANERVHVLPGFIMHVPTRLLRVDGLIVLDGLLLISEWANA